MFLLFLLLSCETKKAKQHLIEIFPISPPLMCNLFIFISAQSLFGVYWAFIIHEALKCFDILSFIPGDEQGWPQSGC